MLKPQRPPALLAALIALPPSARVAGMSITNRRWVRTLHGLLQANPDAVCCCSCILQHGALWPL